MKIGFETHIPLDTKTKLFSDESRDSLSAYGQGEPGTRPVLQAKAIRYALKLALTLDMDITPVLAFDRKQYFYPDLPKGYQITQHRYPIAENGVFTTSQGDTTVKEIHVEEDPSRLKHVRDGTRIDDKRSGEPLIELVSTPSLTTINEALAFLDELATHCSYLGILDETKGFKTDINISIEATQHTRVEVKNVTGRDSVKDALQYESWRQESAVETGHGVRRETRHYDDVKNITTPSRTKESYEDYAYIPEPDIPLIRLEPFIGEVKDELPKPRQDIIDELVHQDVSKQEATTIASDPHKRGFYECFREYLSPRLSQSIITEHIPHVLKAQDKSWQDIDLSKLQGIATAAAARDLPENTVKDLVWNTLFNDTQPEDWMQRQESNEDINETVERVIDEHPSRVEAYVQGKKSVVNAFIGDVRQKHPDKPVDEVIEKIQENLPS